MFCPQCGKELQDGEVCSCQQSQPQTESEVVDSRWKGNEKLFAILSYIGILWLIGLLVSPEKEDEKVRFHVGQGIVLAIADVVLGIVGGIINAILGAIFQVRFLGVGLGYVSTAGAVLQTIVSLSITVIILLLVIKGIINVVNNKQEPLPVIGRFAFYK